MICENVSPFGHNAYSSHRVTFQYRVLRLALYVTNDASILIESLK